MAIASSGVRTWYTSEHPLLAPAEEIHLALKRKPEWRLRLRLQTIELALRGKVDDAAVLREAAGKASNPRVRRRLTTCQRQRHLEAFEPT